jgi:hypothetical protein
MAHLASTGCLVDAPAATTWSRAPSSRAARFRSPPPPWQLRPPTLATACRPPRLTVGPVRVRLLPGIRDEHEAGIDDEHDRGLMVPVMLLGLSVSCSWCRLVILRVPVGSGRTRAWTWCC